MAEFNPALLTLPSLAPSLALELLPRGLTINKIFVQADGRTHDIVVGPENATDHGKIKYHNSIVGRYSNRIPVGKHTIEKNGITAEADILPNIRVIAENNLVSLHGGPIGFDSLPFIQISPATATLFSKAELTSLSSLIPGDSSSSIWRLISEDGDQGFPGKLTTEVLVGLVASNEPKQEGGGESDLGSIVIIYRAKVEGKDGAKAVTPINLTQHWGFNLDASLKEDISAKGHNLTIKAASVLERDALNLPTGNLPEVSGAHIHNGKKIGESFPDEGYDDYYLLSSDAVAPIQKYIPLEQITDPASSLDLLKAIVEAPSKNAVELKSEKSGLKLTFDSNQSGLQFYSYNWPDVNAPRKKIHGGSGDWDKGDGYVPGTAAMIEFHEPLSAFLYPSLQQNGDTTLLTSDEVYNNFVRLRVSTKHVV
ncbi:hypothetical protein HWV62_32429 [Athelia sp. TMB]|nr:hypothetical protein HWV62_32429 [Athelia sp. TMB]